MHVINRRRWGLLVVLAAGASLSCGRSSPGNTIRVTIVTKALDSEWWQRVKAGAEEAARASGGVKLAVMAPEREINIDQQASILEDQITKRISAIAVAPAGVSEILPLLDKAKAAGIPVIIFDTDVDWRRKAELRRVRQSRSRPAGGQAHRRSARRQGKSRRGPRDPRHPHA